jgi:hypothetical protein
VGGRLSAGNLEHIGSTRPSAEHGSWRKFSGGRSHRRRAKISAGVARFRCAPANSGHHKGSNVSVVAPPLRIDCQGSDWGGQSPALAGALTF